MTKKQPSTDKKTSFTEAMPTLGGIAGFFYGAAIGDALPESGTLAGGISGAIIGALLGLAASHLLRIMFQVGFLVAALLLIAARIYWLMGGGSA